LNLLAEKVYLSPSYLSEIFIKETGCGINKYIKNLRMENAKDLLNHTNMKITDICKKVGYHNLSYFVRSFREHFGSSPEKYRQMKKQ
jgi:two-component system response regulator YesN